MMIINKLYILTAINSLDSNAENVKKRSMSKLFTQKILFDEMGLFIEWYLKKYKKY